MPLRWTNEAIDRETALRDPFGAGEVTHAALRAQAADLLTEILGIDPADPGAEVLARLEWKPLRWTRARALAGANSRNTSRRRRVILAVAASAAAFLVARVAGSWGGVAPNHVAKPPAASPVAWRLTGYVTPAAWRIATTGFRSTALGVSCPTSTLCLWDGVGGSRQTSVIMVSHDGGTKWTRAFTGPSHMTLLGGVSCVSTTTCTVVDEPTQVHGPPRATMDITTDGGTHWRAVPLPNGPFYPSRLLACSNARECVVAGTQVRRGEIRSFVKMTTDGGTTWRSGTPPDNVDPAVLKCFASGFCLEIGTTPPMPHHLTRTTAAYSVDGGLTWHAAAVPVGVAQVGALSCSGGRRCLATTQTDGAVTSSVLVSDDGGRTWRVRRAVGLTGSRGPNNFTAASLSCASRTVCWAAGTQVVTVPPPDATRVLTAWGKAHSWVGAIVVTRNAGRTWRPETLPSAQGIVAVTGVSCSSTTRCVAAATTDAAQLILSTAPGPPMRPRTVPSP